MKTSVEDGFQENVLVQSPSPTLKHLSEEFALTANVYGLNNTGDSPGFTSFMLDESGDDLYFRQAVEEFAGWVQLQFRDCSMQTIQIFHHISSVFFCDEQHWSTGRIHIKMYLLARECVNTQFSVVTSAVVPLFLRRC